MAEDLFVFQNISSGRKSRQPTLTKILEPPENLN